MSRRHPFAFWSVFVAAIVLLIIAPLVLPEFWRRFVTEVLIWGLLAMSSDLLIGYTGMVSFGHPAVFGLGMYGVAAAVLPPHAASLWAALLYGLIAAAGVRLRGIFLDPAARHLLRDHDADLLADLLRHHLHLDGVDRRRERTQFRPAGAGDPRSVLSRVHAHGPALVRAGRRRRVLLAAAPHHAVAVRHGAAVDSRERGAHAGDRLPRRTLQDRLGDAVGP